MYIPNFKFLVQFGGELREFGKIIGSFLLEVLQRYLGHFFKTNLNSIAKNGSMGLKSLDPLPKGTSRVPTECTYLISSS